MKQKNFGIQNDINVKNQVDSSFIPIEEDYSKEYNPHRKVNLYQNPNSKRTLNPELAARLIFRFFLFMFKI